MAWLISLIRFLYRRKRFYFKVKNYLIYYFRLCLLGVALGFIGFSFWSSFLDRKFISSIVKLDLTLVSQYKNVFDLWSNTQIQFLVILILVAIFFSLVKAFQSALKGSLIYLGFLSWLFVNDYNFFTDPRFWNKWSAIPNSSLTIIFYLSFWIIIADLLYLIINSVLNQIKVSISPHITSFIENLKETITVNTDKLRIPAFIKTPKKWWETAVSESNSLLNSSDEPLKDLSEVAEIQKTVDNRDLFRIFLNALEDLKSLILSKNNKNGLANSICLDGPWGSGKTSLINIIHNDVLKINDSKIIWIDFDPWNFNSSTELIKDFFETLNNQLINKYKIDLQPNLGLYVDLITPIIESTGLTSNLRSVLTRTPFFAPKNLAVLKKGIVKQLKTIPDKIVIVLDDLDRLKFDELQIVLKLVRQLSNLPNIIFVLPFDYDRVSNLIVKEMGDGYKDFLGKIINDRVRLDPYSFTELEGIFINQIKRNPSDEELSTLKEVFSCYVKEKNRTVFNTTRRLIDQSKQKKSDALMFDFTNDFFRILYPELLLNDVFDDSLKDRVRNLLNFYLSDSSLDGDALEKEIFEKFSLIKKVDMGTKFKTLRPLVDQDLGAVGISGDEQTLFNTIWDNFIKSLDSAESYQDIEREFNEMVNFPVLQSGSQIQTLPNTKVALDEIKQSLIEYKNGFEDNSEYHSFIRNLLVSQITPRQVKALGRSESIYVGSIVGSKDLAIRKAIRIAKMQY